MQTLPIPFLRVSYYFLSTFPSSCYHSHIFPSLICSYFCIYFDEFQILILEIQKWLDHHKQKDQVEFLCWGAAWGWYPLIQVFERGNKKRYRIEIMLCHSLSSYHFSPLYRIIVCVGTSRHWNFVWGSDPVAPHLIHATHVYRPDRSGVQKPRSGSSKIILPLPSLSLHFPLFFSFISWFYLMIVICSSQFLTVRVGLDCEEDDIKSNSLDQPRLQDKPEVFIFVSPSPLFHSFFTSKERNSIGIITSWLRFRSNSRMIESLQKLSTKWRRSSS